MDQPTAALNGDDMAAILTALQHMTVECAYRSASLPEGSGEADGWNQQSAGYFQVAMRLTNELPVIQADWAEDTTNQVFNAIRDAAIQAEDQR